MTRRCEVRSVGGWYCTRERGHDGEHIATCGVYKPGIHVFARWMNEQPLVDERDSEPTAEHEQETR